ncbi:hypothetical protein A0H81_01314 [Grifola frondosa]|uniref:Amidohydrolase-related domain-containing protein n=1 Tax=Grifola frondosa TaxID=5627 RepID=A0A1C7MQ66_GRIFR|nr:hypothetical protein A0H81_01314 [Grifola frondosa]
MKIYAGRLFDPYTLLLAPNRVITVDQDAGLVVDVQPFSEMEERGVDFSAEGVVDLRSETVLPGFVDAHVHFFLHPYSETSWEDQLTKEPLAERTVRATVHARRTLMAGYTAVRDLGTEGAEDADIALRRCLSGPDPLIPGPRYFCANRAIVVTGSYGPKSRLHVNQEGVEGVTGAEIADGEVECVKAVRRQVGAGADWIKIYADYRFRSRIGDVSSATSKAAIRTFNDKEMQALVSTAHQLGAKVSAHAAHWRILTSPEYHGVDSLEHGYDMTSDVVAEEDYLDFIRQYGPTWVPTLAAYYTMDPGKNPDGPWARAARTFQRALQRGVDKIACGGDTGVFAHGDNALEMKLMVMLGAPWQRVLRWATLGGWECVRSMAWEGRVGEERLRRVGEMHEDARIVGDNEVPFGAVRRGFAADIIATSGDLEGDFHAAVDRENIGFVMKGGKVYKQDGRELV